MNEKIVILDFGGQYAHLIASRIRRENVLAEIYNPDEISLNFFKENKVKGLILSGGPQSVYDKDSAKCDEKFFELGIPVLGICYGHQFLNKSLGGKVIPGEDNAKEFGRAELTHDQICPLFKDISEKSVFWMSHGDEVNVLGKGFEVCGTTDSCKNAAVWNKEKNLFGIQFHPEVTHSKFGTELLKNFLNICEVSRDWTIERFYETLKLNLKEKIGHRNIVLFVSGGVDSTVAFALLSQIIGKDRVKGLFVDNGLMRKGEISYVEKVLKNIGTDLTVMSEGDLFLGNLENIYDPEKKREIIGNAFIEVQKKFFTNNNLDENTLLAQGTIYPDTIETGSTKNSSKIKTHHNRVPEIQKMIDKGLVIEPLADLYKDEVRALGTLLGLPKELVWRHPFPGPGLGVRILCNGIAEEESIDNNAAQPPLNLSGGDRDFIALPIKSVGVQGDFRTYKTPGMIIGKKNLKRSIPDLENLSTQLINQNPEINRCIKLLGKNFKEEIKTVQTYNTDTNIKRVKILQDADDIVTKYLFSMNIYQKVWQFPVVLMPLSFNNMGTESVILRPINSIDAMSASVGVLPKEFFKKVTEEMLKDKKISAVFLDITSKPPGTIEWE